MIWFIVQHQTVHVIYVGTTFLPFEVLFGCHCCLLSWAWRCYFLFLTWSFLLLHFCCWCCRAVDSIWQLQMPRFMTGSWKNFLQLSQNDRKVTVIILILPAILMEIDFSILCGPKSVASFFNPHLRHLTARGVGWYCCMGICSSSQSMATGDRWFLWPSKDLLVRFTQGMDGLLREWGLSSIIIIEYHGSFPHSLRLAPVRRQWFTMIHQA